MTQKPLYQLQDFTFLETDSLAFAEKTFNHRFESRRFIQKDATQSPDIRVSLARLPYSNIFTGDFGCTMNAVFTDKVKDYHLFVPLSGHLAYRGDNDHVIKVGHALLLSPGSNLDITWQDNCRGVSVVTLKETFIKFLHNIYGHRNATAINLPQQIDLSQGAGLSVANALHSILSELEDENSLLSQGITTKAHNELLLTAILNTNIDIQKEKAAFISRPPAISSAINFIQENLDHPIQLNDIAKATGTSVRTLQAQFKRHVGLNPMKFVSLEKFNKIRQKLLESNPLSINVADIAAEHGFYHASNFSRNYKRHFGESPSETLKTQLK